MSTLVIVEHDNNSIKESTLNTITAAKKLACKIDLLVAGYDCGNVSKTASKIEGINKVLQANKESYKHFFAENIAALIVEIAKNYDNILAPATTFGKNFMPQVAAMLDVEQISDIVSVESKDTFVRPIYAGNALAYVQSSATKKIITVRTTTFEKANVNLNTNDKANNANIEELNIEHNLNFSEFVSMNVEQSDRPDLTSAKVVVAGGRGFQNKEHFQLLEQLADSLNAAIGATRAVIDAGIIKNDYQIGQTGKVVAPDLYIAAGISGAIQHVAGIKDSKVIVAINKDADAPIFQVADYGIVGDLFILLPEFISQLEKNGYVANKKKETISECIAESV